MGLDLGQKILPSLLFLVFCAKSSFYCSKLICFGNYLPKFADIDPKFADIDPKFADTYCKFLCAAPQFFSKIISKVCEIICGNLGCGNVSCDNKKYTPNKGTHTGPPPP